MNKHMTITLGRVHVGIATVWFASLLIFVEVFRYLVSIDSDWLFNTMLNIAVSYHALIYVIPLVLLLIVLHIGLAITCFCHFSGCITLSRVFAVLSIIVFPFETIGSIVILLICRTYKNKGIT